MLSVIRLFLVFLITTFTIQTYLFYNERLAMELDKVKLNLSLMTSSLREIENIINIINIQNPDIADNKVNGLYVTSPPESNHVNDKLNGLYVSHSPESNHVNDKLNNYMYNLDKTNYKSISDITGDFLIRDWGNKSVLASYKLRESTVGKILNEERCKIVNICFNPVNYVVSAVHQDALTGAELFSIFKAVDDNVDVGFNFNLKNMPYFLDKNIKIQDITNDFFISNQIIINYPYNFTYIVYTEVRQLAPGITVIVYIPYIHILSYEIISSLIMSFIISIMIFFVNRNNDMLIKSESYRLESIKDPLTNCYNRRYFEFNNITNNAGFALMIDGNKIKNINDNLGHLAGDNAIRSISKGIFNVIRESDIIIRTGGDEFLLLIDGCIDDEVIKGIIEKIHSSIARHSDLEISLDGTRLSVSIGLCKYEKGDPYLAIISQADKAMYEQK